MSEPGTPTGERCPKCKHPLVHTPYDQHDGWCDRCWMTFTKHKGKLVSIKAAWQAQEAAKGRKK